MLALDMSVGMADGLFFLTGALPEPGAVLELCSGDDREVVMVESLAGSCSVLMARALRGTVAREWRCGQVLRAALEFSRMNGVGGGPWWECSLCGSPVTGPGRDRHAHWHQALQVSV